ncbi:hypothetical protein V8G54_009371 [Vigna mungo]|uniref:SWIM-type domain-containing protein n=1 Tax=Vigna mungo TaxID=3915 RepID=A0AAQ3S224_VIGMU
MSFGRSEGVERFLGREREASEFGNIYKRVGRFNEMGVRKGQTLDWCRNCTMFRIEQREVIAHTVQCLVVVLLDCEHCTVLGYYEVDFGRAFPEIELVVYYEVGFRSYFEILTILKEMGYMNVKELQYSLGHGPMLEECLEPLFDDKGACHVVNIAILNGEAHLYVIHMVCEPEYVLELEAVGNVEPEVEAELEVEGRVEVEVEPVGNVEVVVEAETEAVGNVQGVVEVQTETTADGVEAHVQDDVEGQADVEGDVEVDVRSWNGSEEDVLSNHGDEVAEPRGLSDSDWEYKTLNSVVESDDIDDDRDRYGDFGVFSMPKSMEQYKWEVGRKCPSNAYCAYKGAEKIWQLKKIKTLKENPNINLYNLHNKVSKNWNIGVSRSTTCRAKAIVIKQIEVHVEPNEDTRIFKRLYVCLKACKDNFVSCRPIIGLDGCFLKGKFGGELLTAVARDGNDQMCLLAYVVVEVENKDSWGWFLQLLIDDLGGGLLPALQELLPGVKQRFCVRHIYANFRKRFPGQILKRLLWKAAASTHPQAWEAVMREIKDVNPDAFKYLVVIPPRIFEVRHSSMIGEKYVGDIDKFECSCRKWTLIGIPCCHALAAMTFLNINGQDYVPHWFTKSTYQETYIPIIYPVNGPDLWEITSHPDVLPLPKRVLPGRPKKEKARGLRAKEG